MAHSLLLFSSVIGFVSCYSENAYYFENHKYCDDLSPYYGEINMDSITGVWYGVEKIPHLKGEYKIEHTRECFYIDIKELYIEPTPPTPYPPLTNSPYVNRQFPLHEPYRVRHLVLEWHEGLWRDDYHIKVNTSHKGFWPTDVPNRLIFGPHGAHQFPSGNVVQTTSPEARFPPERRGEDMCFAVDDMYRFFGGVIQVLKVANNHLVLNFCMRLPNSQLYSVVLSRNENQLTAEDLASIHNVFTLKHLSTSALKRVCENSAVMTSASYILLVSLGVMLWRSRG